MLPTKMLLIVCRLIGIILRKNAMDKRLQLIGDQIRFYRQQLGISQEKLADLTGLHRTYIGSVERGERNITLLNLIKIAEGLNIKVKDILINQ